MWWFCYVFGQLRLTKCLKVGGCPVWSQRCSLRPVLEISIWKNGRFRVKTIYDSGTWAPHFELFANWFYEKYWDLPGYVFCGSPFFRGLSPFLSTGVKHTKHKRQGGGERLQILNMSLQSRFWRLHFFSLYNYIQFNVCHKSKISTESILLVFLLRTSRTRPSM